MLTFTRTFIEGLDAFVALKEPKQCFVLLSSVCTLFPIEILTL